MSEVFAPLLHRASRGRRFVHGVAHRTSDCFWIVFVVSRSFSLFPKPSDVLQASANLEGSSGKFTYVILPGNESVLMAEAMQRREWWRPVEKGSPNHFWWGGNGQRVGWQDYQRGMQSLTYVAAGFKLHCSADTKCALSLKVSQGKLSIKWRATLRFAPRHG